MGRNKVQFIDLTESQRSECEQISAASGSGWWRVDQNRMPSFVPDGLKPKLDGGVMVLSGSASGATYLMYGAERIDTPVAQVDIQPFGHCRVSLGIAFGDGCHTSRGMA